MTEQTLLNIERLTVELNTELRAAYNSGLKVYIGGNGMLMIGAPYLSIRIWRETPLLEVQEGGGAEKTA